MLGSILLISSCARQTGTGYAENLCHCAQESGMMKVVSQLELFFSRETSESMDRSERKKIEYEMNKCGVVVLKEMQEALEGMDREERKDFAREFISGMIYSECGDELIDLIPWSMALSLMDESIDDMERKAGRNFGFGAMDVCDCMEEVNSAGGIDEVSKECAEILENAEFWEIEECEGSLWDTGEFIPSTEEVTEEDYYFVEICDCIAEAVEDGSAEYLSDDCLEELELTERWEVEECLEDMGEDPDMHIPGLKLWEYREHPEPVEIESPY